MKFAFENSSITSICCSVPSNSVDLISYSKEIGIEKKEAEKIIKTTGISEIKLTHEDQTSFDLCYDAAKHILNQMNQNDIENIDCILYVSQTRDFILPQTSNIFQNKLGLNTDVICLDIPLGCSGYVYGLFQANLLINAGCNKVLLLAGDASTKMISKYDKTVSMVFGDAGSATLISNSIKSKSFFDLGNDGEGYKSLIIRDGGFRNPITPESKLLKKIDNGISRSNKDLYMDGLAIMNFAISRVPQSVKNVLQLAKIEKDQIDLFFLHQANEFMIKYLSKKLKIDYKKVPFEANKFGNTGPASIPLAICEYFLKNKINKKNKIVLSGFGVGLSWASSIVEIEELINFKINNI